MSHRHCGDQHQPSRCEHDCCGQVCNDLTLSCAYPGNGSHRPEVLGRTQRRRRRNVPARNLSRERISLRLTLRELQPVLAFLICHSSPTSHAHSLCPGWCPLTAAAPWLPMPWQIPPPPLHCADTIPLPQGTYHGYEQHRVSPIKLIFGSPHAHSDCIWRMGVLNR